ncbi:hypothetical protein SAMN05216466_106218 [Paraburkholderia phenazinium]|uniref:Uncharacterized protein n=1 Tax=Paraburkholderia phenazinium TaxID=60549 RepID=A0A1G7YJF7_9BURK|nr:hypothetical protein [Paraburkholderia phenazinium]SDG96708.1 hypothetical protein SAMN05216466_106218 [Paraburkholderia phenazinium]
MTDLTNAVRDDETLLCEEGHYPYPDACVKVVMALELGGHADIARLATLILVSTKDDVAESLFNNRYPGFCAHTVSSLDDVRWQVKQLRELDAKRRDGWLMRKLRRPYMVTFRWTMDVLHRRFVLAVSATDAHDREVPRPYAGMAMSLSDLETLLARMERVKTGEESAEYAWDFRKGGDFDRHAKRRWTTMPPEEKAWYTDAIKAFKETYPDEVRSSHEEDHHD